MKIKIVIVLLTITATIILIKLTQPIQDIPREAANNVVSFSILNGSIYGTGSHITYKGYTYIITNAHICQATLELNKSIHAITSSRVVKIIKMWKQHDLCALKSWKTKGLQLADTASLPLDIVHLLGHPRGMKLTIRTGRVVEDKEVYVSMVGHYKSTLISTITYTGNSGSPVINKQGEVTGVLFTGSIKHNTEGYMVPHSYLKAFLEELYVTYNKENKIDNITHNNN